jgi:arylsulfatase A-like enzyme
MDVLPTVVDLAGGEKPKDRKIDGRSFSKLLLPAGDGKIVTEIAQYNQLIHKIIFFYCVDGSLMAVRYKQYKIHFRFVNPNVEVAHRINCDGIVPRQDYYHSTCVGAIEAAPPIIYDLSVDPAEEMPLLYQSHKAMIKEAWKLINKHKKSLNDLPVPLLQKNYCDKKYIPCCNPPFCIC